MSDHTGTVHRSWMRVVAPEGGKPGLVKGLACSYCGHDFGDIEIDAQRRPVGPDFIDCPNGCAEHIYLPKRIGGFLWSEDRGPPTEEVEVVGKVFSYSRSKPEWPVAYAITPSDGSKVLQLEHYEDCLCNLKTIAAFDGRIVKIIGHRRMPWLVVVRKIEACD